MTVIDMEHRTNTLVLLPARPHPLDSQLLCFLLNAGGTQYRAMMDSSSSVRNSRLVRSRTKHLNIVNSTMQHAHVGRKEAQVLNLKVLAHCGILV